MEEGNLRFRVEVTPDQGLMEDGYRAVIWRSWQAGVYAAVAVLCLGAAGYRVYEACHWARLGWTNIWDQYIFHIVYFLLLAGFVIWRLFSAPGRAARKNLQRLTAVHGDTAKLKITYSFDGDAMHSLGSSGQRIDTAYDQIISVHETERGIVLRRKLSLFETLDKSTIQGGSLQDFRVFLQEKMPQARFHWKEAA